MQVNCTPIKQRITLDDEGGNSRNQNRGESQVHRTTVQRNLKNYGVKAWVKPKKPNLEPHQKHARLAFAQQHEKWTIEQWKNVMFSDESSISRIGSFGRQYFYSDREHKRLEPHQVKETKQAGGGKIMAWGCMTYYVWSWRPFLDPGKDQFGTVPRCAQGLCPPKSRLV